MVHYKLSLVWGFPFIVFVCVAYGPLQTFASVGLSVIYRFWFLFVSHMVHYWLSLVWGFLFFIVFVRVAYGPLQTLASVGLSVFYCFCSCCIWLQTPFFIIFIRIAYGLLQTLASVGLAQVLPNYAMLQSSKFWPNMLNNMLKNKNCAHDQHITQVCMNKALLILGRLL